MNVKSIGFWMVMTILLTTSLSGCYQKVDESLIGSETCSPPCVWGIQPGITETTIAVQLLKEYEANDDGRLTILDSGIIRWRASNKNFYFYSRDNLITHIDTRLNSTKLKEVINLFGQPSYVDRGKLVDGSYFLSLLYPEKGLLFVVGGDKELYRVEANMNVVKAVFSQPSDIATMINSSYGKEIIEETLANIQTWQGYGNY